MDNQKIFETLIKLYAEQENLKIDYIFLDKNVSDS